MYESWVSKIIEMTKVKLENLMKIKLKNEISRLRSQFEIADNLGKPVNKIKQDMSPCTNHRGRRPP